MRFFIMLSITLLLTSCHFFGKNGKVATLLGNTMGTTYVIRVVSEKSTPDAVLIKDKIKTVLREINKSLSNWDKDSEISNFNKNSSIEPIQISSHLSNVLSEAFLIHKQSEKKFDVTVSPLISLWGFGPKKNSKNLPTNEQINIAMEKVGMTQFLQLTPSPSPTLQKSKPEVSINLSSIAKGYGIDKVAEAIKKLGFNNYLVEIGGDLISSGTNPYGKGWRIGIEKPNASGRSVQKIVTTSGLAMATSGDYRNYIEKDGKRYSHIIDPKTGRPITHKLASVTVLSDSAMRADGWATALYVLGEEDGLRIAEKNNIAAFFIIRTENGYIEKSSTRFKTLTKQ